MSLEDENARLREEVEKLRGVRRAARAVVMKFLYESPALSASLHLPERKLLEALDEALTKT